MTSEERQKRIMERRRRLRSQLMNDRATRQRLKIENRIRRTEAAFKWMENRDLEIDWGGTTQYGIYEDEHDYELKEDPWYIRNRRTEWTYYISLNPYARNRYEFIKALENSTIRDDYREEDDKIYFRNSEAITLMKIALPSELTDQIQVKCRL